jgi:hypothetical protein
MDVFSHGLWTAAIAKTANQKKEKTLRTWVVVIFGVFPDVFAFAAAFVFMGYLELVGRKNPFTLRSTGVEPPISQEPFILRLTHYFYDFSHSLFIFFIIFGLVAWYYKKPIWEMGGWLLHILIDIPTHSFAFFPTPFLWPISNFKVNGTHWGTLRFEVINYSLIILAYISIWLAGKRKKNEDSGLAR